MQERVFANNLTPFHPELSEMTKSNHKSSSERDEIVSYSLLGVFQWFGNLYIVSTPERSRFPIPTKNFKILHGFIPLQVSSTTSTRSGLVEQVDLMGTGGSPILHYQQRVRPCMIKLNPSTLSTTISLG